LSSIAAKIDLSRRLPRGLYAVVESTAASHPFFDDPLGEKLGSKRHDIIIFIPDILLLRQELRTIP